MYLLGGIGGVLLAEKDMLDGFQKMCFWKWCGVKKRPWRWGEVIWYAWGDS